MLSLMENVRVFEGSDDIEIYTAFNHHEKSKRNTALQRNKRINKDTKVDEDEQLNLQHFCVLQQENNESVGFEREIDANSIKQEPVAANKHDRRLLELVFLSSGEIRTRNDRSISSQVPHFQQKKILESENRVKTTLKYCNQENLTEKGDEVKEEQKTDGRQSSYETSGENRKTKLVEKISRLSRRQEVDGHHNRMFDLSLSSLSEESKDLSNDDDRSDESKRSEESEKQEKDQFGLKKEQTRQAVRNEDEQVSFQNHSVARVAGDGANRRTRTRSLTMGHLEREQGDGTSGQATDRTHSVRHTTGFGKKDAPLNGDTSHGARQRSAPLEQVEQVLRSDRSNDVSTRRSKRSSKMAVGHLASDEPISRPKIITSSRSENSMIEIDRMEKELQKEKQRVLEKTTRLLDEQDKNQQLRDKVGVLKARLSAQGSEINSETRRVARDHDQQKRKSEKEQNDRVNELEEQLTIDLEQLKKTESELSSNQHYDTVEVAGLRAELDDMNRRLYEFLAKVERWKSNSKEKTQNIDDKKTDLRDFLENLWLGFPQFSGIVPKPHSERPSRSSERQQQSIINVDEQANVAFFLKKRLREREDKLRQTHIKYMELKEMCARQCVREADLQNFINAHRLRGNLIIRKNSSSKSKGADSNQEQVQKDQHEKSRRTHLHGENEDEYGNLLRTSNVFVQVGRGRVCEHASTTNSAVPQKRTTDQSQGKRRMQPKQQQQEELVERIRCRSSLSLTQQFERVAQGKKSAQQPLIQPRLEECPPRCGSHPSFMRRKAPTTAAQAKRPITTSVIRPWI
ncbi:unnamed protein product [Peronospora destructor]|uniref:Uncharacterized protein n=1 Tax=Peronospora destructor TaxID=86335 RepID=A0AAV0VBE9_9STRA|nr:unnamed protein product [Peronospora destructor]